MLVAGWLAAGTTVTHGNLGRVWSVSLSTSVPPLVPVQERQADCCDKHGTGPYGASPARRTKS